MAIDKIKAVAIFDGTIDTADIANDAITNAKIADDAIDSEHITDGAIDNVHLATGISSSKLTGALPALDGSALTGISAGKVLQVVQSTTSTQGNTGGPYSDTGLSASITPSSSSNKILVMVTQPMTFTISTSAARESYVRLMRDSTTLATATQQWDIYIGSFTADNFVYSINYLDSPSETSSVTYKTQFSVSAGTCDIYAQKGGNSQSQITLMEIEV